MYCKKFLYEEGGIKPTQTENYSTLHNDTKYEIRLVKGPNLKKMLKYGVPARLWDI